MSNITASAVPATGAQPPILRRKPGRWLLLIGLLLPFLAIGVFAILVMLQRLSYPWYVPGAATLSVLLVAAALWQGRSIWRVLALLFVLLLAAGEWSFVVLIRLPPYTGPAAVSKPFPAFATLRADSTPVNQHNLEGDTDNVLVAFRGRW